MQTVLCGPLAYDGGFPGLKQAMDPKAHFYRHFEAEATSLQDEIANLGNVAVTGGERQDATDHILTGISRLTNEVSDASDYAPPRDQMIYNQALKALREQLNTQTSRLGSKGHFSFSSLSKEKFLSSSSSNRTNVTTTKAQQDERAEKNDALSDLPHFGATKGKNYNAEIAAQQGAGIRKPSFSTARDIDISGHRRMHIILPGTAARATTSGSVTNLRSCVLDMSVPTINNNNPTSPDDTNSMKKKRAAGRKASPFASLTIKDVSNSLVIAGHVAGPAHITGVRDSVLVVNARQVRIHECENVSVWLWCGSHPIIEDCRDMRFAEIPAQYLTENQSPSGNQWNQVDDFKWLKAEASPNWRTITSEEDRAWVPAWFWETTVRGGPSLSTNDILRAAGLSP